MRRFFLALCVGTLAAGSLPAQQNSAPQTARQALMEMFFSKSPGTLAKHLPAITQAALEKSGAMASVQQYSTFAAQLETQGKNLQTFETGPVLMSVDDPKTGQKFEIKVENDALRGDQDDIEISIQATKTARRRCRLSCRRLHSP